MSNDIFQLYQEPRIFVDIIHWFSALTYFLIFATALYILRLVIYANTNKILTHKIIVGISLIITALNYYQIYTVSFFGISIIYILLAIFSYKLIESKSLKWINLSLALFILFIILTYNLFNTKIHEITYPYFSTNDILQYTFEYKPYFQIYRPDLSDFLGKVNFVVDGQMLEIRNDPLEFRIYAFYYVLNSIAIAFWLFIYFDILVKHNLKFKRIKEESTKGWIWISPHTINPVIHLSAEKIKLDIDKIN